MSHPQPAPDGPVGDFLKAEEPRRDFMTQAAAIVTGAALGVVPLAAGVGVFLDPLRQRSAKSGGGKDSQGFLKVGLVDALTVGGAPRRFEVIDDQVDAWNMFPKQPIGAVYLLRTSDAEVRAFNVKCPHAGCSVDFKSEAGCYQCPCHDSSFQANDGKILNPNSPSPRGLDELLVEVRPGSGGSEIWVQYLDFQPGTSHKVPEA